jgi:hypothetical protein
MIVTKASTILQCIHRLRGDLHGTFEKKHLGWLVVRSAGAACHRMVVRNPRNVALRKNGSKSDQIGARELAEQVYRNKLKPVYHGEHGLRTKEELARSYLAIIRDLTRVMNRLKALYRSWGISYHCTLRVTVTNCGKVPSLVEVETGKGEPGTGVSTPVVWSMAYPETEGGWFANWVPR